MFLVSFSVFSVLSVPGQASSAQDFRGDTEIVGLPLLKLRLEHLLRKYTGAEDVELNNDAPVLDQGTAD